jgi:hydrogenase maturation protease
MRRVLVAGFGNELRGDDAFGVAVCQRLEAQEDCGFDILEVGTGGLQMTQQLLGGYDRLIVVDAMNRGGAPGELYVLQVEGIEPAADIDLHLAVPRAALSVAHAMGVLPREVFLVGCEPAEVDELALALSAPVRGAVERAVSHVIDLARRP